MGLMTSIRQRMTIVLWALLFLFVLSMSIGGLVGGANIIDQIAGRVDPNKVIARINGKDISPEYFNNLVNQQINQAKANGQQINDMQYERARTSAWNNLVQEVLVNAEIEKLELKATDEEVLYHLKENPPQFIKDNPTFQTDAKFDKQKYLTALSSPQGDEWAPIEDWMRNSYIPNFKLTQYLNQSSFVSDNDILNEYIKRNTKYTIDAIHVTYDKVTPSKLETTENELLTEYEINLEEYKHDELRNISFVSWKKVASKEDSSKIGSLANDIIKKAKNGQIFSDLAKEYSTDPGSQQNGGDLGWFSKGQMVKPFEEAAFKGKKGTIVGPVESRFGTHIIKIRDKKTENEKEMVLASHILLKTEASATTLSNLRRTATLYSYDAQDSGFVASANKQGLNIKSEKKINMSASRLRELGPFRSAIRFSFFNEVGMISDVLENDQYLMVLHVDSIINPGYTSFSDVKNQIENKLKKEKQRSLSKDMVEEVMIDMNANDKELESIIKKQTRYTNIDNETKSLSEGFTSIGRANYVTGALLNANKDELVGPVETNNGWAIIHVKNISNIDSSEFAVQRETIKNNITTRMQNQNLQAWLDELKENAEIIDNRNYFY